MAARSSVSTLLMPRTDRIRWWTCPFSRSRSFGKSSSRSIWRAAPRPRPAKRLGIPLAAVKPLIAYFAEEVSEVGRPYPDA